MIAARLLLLVPLTSRAGATATRAILAAALITLIRDRDWVHLPDAFVLIAATALVATGCHAH